MGQGEIFPGQDFDRGRRSTYSVSRRDTPLHSYQVNYTQMVRIAVPYAYGCTVCVYEYGMYHTRIRGGSRGGGGGFGG